jgi:hypothetical protein
MLLSSAICGILVCVASYLAVHLFAPGGEILPALGLALFALGFSIGWLLFGSWLLVRAALSNSAMDSDTVRSPIRAPHGARHRER